MSPTPRNTRFTDFASWCRQWLSTTDARALLYASVVYGALLLLMFGSWTLFTPQEPEPVQAVRVHVVKPSDIPKTKPAKPEVKKPVAKKSEPAAPKPATPVVNTNKPTPPENTVKDKVEDKRQKSAQEKPAPSKEKTPTNEKKTEPKPEAKTEPKSDKPAPITKTQTTTVTGTTTKAKDSGTPSVSKVDAPAENAKEKKPETKSETKPQEKTQEAAQSTTTTTSTPTKPEVRQPKKTNFADLLDDEPGVVETLAQNTTPTETTTAAPSGQNDLSGQRIEDAEATFSATQLAEKEAQISAIKSAVELAWVRPASATNQMSVEVEVRLLADGKIMKKTLAQSSGNAAFDQSVLAALDKVEYLPVPDDAVLFDAYFRELLFKFSPDDL